ncbi:hypothetical protein SAMN04490244_11642 [Tranquillimonas rosea]|uniref:DUF4177 domain-containing protein n=1 Tax=Tranquillimonas rosea TaxID=641238 RepID=A0A1H9X1D5_9RHOB|nr:DUF4177 domain-containing protein [Tranquillimonas rosea]SES39899.1 hypothetical protein SAMN04490244_11642 [Tranquillimonas rosea]
MMKFEHEVDTIDTRKKAKEMPAILAQRSEEGWELVSVVTSGPTDLHLFFKRPMAAGPKAVA